METPQVLAPKDRKSYLDYLRQVVKIAASEQAARGGGGHHFFSQLWLRVALCTRAVVLTPMHHLANANKDKDADRRHHHSLLTAQFQHFNPIDGDNLKGLGESFQRLSVPLDVGGGGEARNKRSPQTEMISNSRKKRANVYTGT